MRFTDRSIQALKPKADRYEAWEDNGKGFGLRVSPAGRKTFMFMYRFKGKARRMTIGVYPRMTLATAHTKHAEARKKLVEEKTDPGALKQQKRAWAKAAPTVQDLADEYMEKYAKKKKRSWREDQRMLDKYILPHWKNKKVEEIRRRDLILLLDDIGAPVQANRVLACVRKVFNFAVDRGILEATPFNRMKLPNEEKERTRTLSVGEIKAFWNKLDDAATEKRTRLALKFLLVTAQRSIEVTEAERREINFKKRTWTIPASKAKNGYEHTVPLPVLAMELLEEVYALGGDTPYVFPDKKDGDKPMNEGTLRQAVSRNLDAFGIDHFVPHDLRRTASTIMRSLVDGKWVEKVLNHVPPKLERTYDRHDYANEKRQALAAWAHKLETITGGGGKVVPMVKK